MINVSLTHGELLTLRNEARDKVRKALEISGSDYASAYGKQKALLKIPELEKRREFFNSLVRESHPNNS